MAVVLTAGVLAVSGIGTAALVGIGGAGSVTGSPSSSTVRSAATVHPATAADPMAAARTLALQTVLDRRSDAVLHGNRAEWAGGLDPTASTVRAEQLSEYGRIRQLPVQSWHYDVVAVDPSGAGSTQSFGATVRLRFRLVGDTRDVERPQRVTLVQRSAGWLLSAVSTTSVDRDPWELGPLTVQRGRRVLVIGVGTGPQLAGRLRQTAQEADAAANQVSAVWGKDAVRSAVVILPQDVVRMATLIGRPSPAGLDQVAAMTTGELDRTRVAGGGAADRVVLNPEAFPRLAPIGRRVVLAHELTHVVTRAAARLSPPLWVEEGFANYVAYRSSGLTPSVVASDVVPLVRAGTAPTQLPGPEAFDATHGQIAPAYADAWLAFAVIARQGSARPLAFYRTVAGLGSVPNPPATAEQSLQLAYQQVLGLTPEQFRQRWLAYRLAVSRSSR
jgi:hypothetical protein